MVSDHGRGSWGQGSPIVAGTAGAPVFRPAPPAAGGRKRASPVGQKCGDGLNRRPLGSSPGGARHRGPHEQPTERSQRVQRPLVSDLSKLFALAVCLGCSPWQAPRILPTGRPQPGPAVRRGGPAPRRTFDPKDVRPPGFASLPGPRKPTHPGESRTPCEAAGSPAWPLAARVQGSNIPGDHRPRMPPPRSVRGSLAPFFRTPARIRRASDQSLPDPSSEAKTLPSARRVS